jgi:DNA repair exonuclease SbcCD ATPase subunit
VGDHGFAAKAVRVSPRTIRRYIDQGKLEAMPQGEGVRREWFVSVDSLHALRATRTTEEPSPHIDRLGHAEATADSIADVLREMAARLERRAEEAAELRVRLERTERAQSTLEDERRRALEELEQARRRQAEIERERDQLVHELEALRRGREEAPPRSETPTKLEPAEQADAGRSEPDREPPERSEPEKVEPERVDTEKVDSASPEPREEPSERRSWWRRWFGG